MGSNPTLSAISLRIDVMDAMFLHPSWTDIALRLFLSALAGALVGFNRQRGGHAAGLRTIMLITLAACVAMIQASLLLGASGKSASSFAEMDVLRLPLGVLTGVGFIGGGAILRRGNEVAGVTTAASIWIMTIVGLCFGGGQLLLGCIATVLTFIIVAPAKLLDRRIKREFDAHIVVRASAGTEPAMVAKAIEDLGCEARLTKYVRLSEAEMQFFYALRWLAGDRTISIETLLERHDSRFMITDVEIVSEVT